MNSGTSTWPPTLRSLLACALGALAILASSCASDAASDEVATQAEQSADVEPTSVPEPTAAPEPTPVPEPTMPPESTAVPEPDPTPETEPVLEPFDQITATVRDFVDGAGINGAGLVIVERDDGVVYEEYFGEFDADRISLIASSSKMISAGVLLRLQEDGLLDIDAPIEGQVDWALGNPDITPAQLVSNSSGLVGLGPDFLYPPYVCQWGVPVSLQECGQTVFTTSDDDDDQAPPDTEFRYGGAQWQVAGAVAESASGKSWAELIDEIYVGPCGVASLGYISLGAVLTGAPGYPVSFAGDPSGVTESANPSIEGGAHITVGDYAKLLLMHLRGGMCGDEQVLSQESLDTMHSDRIAEVYDGDAWAATTGYGMGWWVDRETNRISDGGAWGALPWLDLDDGYGAYIIVEDESATGQALQAEIEELVHTAVTS